MTLHEEALELRKKICATAPEAYKRELSGKPWEVAVLCAEAYFRVNGTSETPSVSEYADTCVRLYREGRSIIFISEYLEIEQTEVLSAIQQTGDPVAPIRECSLHWLKTHNLVGITGIQVPPLVVSKPDADEVKAVKRLRERFSLDDVAINAHRPPEQIKFILGETTPKASEKEEVKVPIEQILDLYKKGRSPYFIHEYLNVPRDVVESTLASSELPYVRGYVYQNIRSFLNAGKYIEEFSMPMDGIKAAQDAVRRSSYKTYPEPIETHPDEKEVKMIRRWMLSDSYLVPYQSVYYSVLGRTKTNTVKIVQSLIDSVNREKEEIKKKRGW